MNSKKNSPQLEIVDAIEKIRQKNNGVWMDLVRLAITHAPQEAKALLKEIEQNDAAVTALCRLLRESIPD